MRYLDFDGRTATVVELEKCICASPQEIDIQNNTSKVNIADRMVEVEIYVLVWGFLN